MLTDEELTHFSEDLKHFLIVNGVHSEDWEKMNLEAPDKALELIGLFSDTVLQRVYENIKYLEFRSPDSCMLFYLGQEVIHLISIQAKTGTSVDLSSPEGIHVSLVQQPESLSFFKTTKTYHVSREDEVHGFLEQGCVPSSQEFWDSMQLALRD